MNYADICEREKEESENLRKVMARLKDVSGANVLLFAHDDPDGVASASIMYRILAKGGAKKIHTVLPEGFDVFPREVDAEAAHGPFDLFVIVDKGSKETVDRVVEEKNLETIVVDHHFLFGEPKKALLYNPLLTKRPYCSAGYVCHMIATLMGRNEPIDDFDALVSLKADFAVDPAVGNDGTDFVAPFVEEVRPKWKNLFQEISGTATLFDTTQREKTTLLSQIAEVYFAVTGGAFQYFYPDDEILGKVNQPKLCFEGNLRLANKVEDLKKVQSLDDFFALLAGDEKAWRRAYERFQSNWDDVMRKMETAVPLGRANGATLYLFTSDRLPLIPMVGGIVLADKVKKHGDGDGVIVMASTEVTSQGNVGTHFSLRATSDKVHVGKICQALAARLNEIYHNPEEISGGGHPRAGECRTRNANVPHLEALAEGLRVLQEILRLEAKAGSWSEDEKRRAAELGIGPPSVERA